MQAARRIIAEWPALDQQQATFTASVDAKYKAQEAAFAAEAPAADAGDGSTGEEASACNSGEGSCGVSDVSGTDHSEL